MTFSSGDSSSPRGGHSWITRSVVGIVLATFLSDFSHEMCTAVLPLYLATLGLGPAALGLIEGVADFLVSLSKLAGGVVGAPCPTQTSSGISRLSHNRTGQVVHRFRRRTWSLVSLRGVAWIGRGFRGPLRDYLLADAVEPTHYGRAYGLERAGDMLGAVVGPLMATLLVWAGIEFRTVILWTLIPGLLAAGSIFFLIKERETAVAFPGNPTQQPRRPFPRAFWIFLVGVLLFGLGDFSGHFLSGSRRRNWTGRSLRRQGPYPSLCFCTRSIIS